jgi:hypothetical protein
MNIVKELQRKVKVKGFNVPAMIRISWEYEQDAIDVAFETEKDNQEYIERFNTGELSNVIIFVEASIEGELGRDTLGACHVRSRYFDKDILETVETYGMIDNAVKEAIDTVTNKALALRKYAE